ncbi:MAG: PEP-CTERM sorting domain-containing protein [Betaproteobacteria bacterium]
MLLRSLYRIAGIAFVLSGASLSHAAVVYDESVSSDLSNDGLAPTSVSIAAGSNQILGTSGDPGTGVDRDYFTVTIPTGFALAQLVLLPGTTIVGAVSFLGLESGNQVTLDANAFSAAGLLGWTHYSSADIATDLLPAMSIPRSRSDGFQVPLGAGSYAFWVQEFDVGTANYGLDLKVVAIPEPSSMAMMLAALAIAAGGLRRRKDGRSRAGDRA